MKSKDKSTVPYDDDHNAAFYRLPAGIRRAQKEIEKEEDGKRTSVCFLLTPAILKSHLIQIRF